MPQTDEKPGDSLTRCFNAMSWARRRELQTAALFKTLSSDMRADVHENPWKFPAYALYITVMACPSPLLGHGLLMASMMVAWAKIGLTPGARALDDRLRDAFHPVRLMTEHAPFLAYSSRPPHIGVRSMPLLADTIRHNFRDVRDTTKDALTSLNRVFSP